MEIENLGSQSTAEAEWDAYVHAHPRASVYHLAAFRGFIHSATGHRTHYLQARRSGSLVGVLPLVELKSRLFGHYFVALPYFNHCGILADDDAALCTLADAAAQRVRATGARHLELRHLDAAPALEWPVKSVKDEMMLELPSTADALLAGLRSNRRGQIKRAQRNGLTTRVGGVEFLEAFYHVFARNMRDLGTPVYGRSFFNELFARLSERLSIVLCELDRAPVAAGILVSWGQTIEIPWASSLRSHNPLAPNILLYWAALNHAIEQGYRVFDFGRSTRDEGTWRFKTEWGARPVPLHWYYFLPKAGALPELNPKNPRYRLAIRIWQRLPLVITNFVGPEIVKNLP